MYNQLLQMEKKMEKIIREKSSKTDWKKELEWFQGELVCLNQERIIHLIATMTVGIVGLISIYMTLSYLIAPIILLDIIFFGLFVAYIFHYKKLEDMATRWYKLINKLQRKSD